MLQGQAHRKLIIRKVSVVWLDAHVKVLDGHLKVVDRPSGDPLEHTLLCLGHFLSFDKVVKYLLSKLVKELFAQIYICVKCFLVICPLIASFWGK